MSSRPVRVDKSYDYVLEPSPVALPLVEPLQTRVVQVACGRAHSLVLTDREGGKRRTSLNPNPQKAAERVVPPCRNLSATCHTMCPFTSSTHRQPKMNHYQAAVTAHAESSLRSSGTFSKLADRCSNKRFTSFKS